MIYESNFAFAISEFVQNDDLSYPETKVELLQRIEGKENEIRVLERKLGNLALPMSDELKTILIDAKEEFKLMADDYKGDKNVSIDDLLAIENIVNYLGGITNSR